MLKTQIKQRDLLQNKERLFADAQDVWHELRKQKQIELTESRQFERLLSDLQKQTLAYPSKKLRQDFLEKLRQTVKNEHTKHWLWWNNERRKVIALTAIICVQRMMFKG